MEYRNQSTFPNSTFPNTTFSFIPMKNELQMIQTSPARDPLDEQIQKKKLEVYHQVSDNVLHT